MEVSIALVGRSAHWTFHGEQVAYFHSPEKGSHLATIWELFTLRIALNNKDGLSFVIAGRNWRVRTAHRLLTLGHRAENLNVMTRWHANDPLRIRELASHFNGVMRDPLKRRDRQLKLIVVVLLNELKHALRTLWVHNKTVCGWLCCLYHILK